LCAIAEYSTGPTAGQGERHDGSRYGLSVFVLYLDDRFTGCSLADVVDCPVALDHHQVEHRRNLGLCVRQKQKRQYYR
jgi:hypothetical protein